MVEETKSHKPSDARPKYEPPTVLRIGARKGAGADCMSGSGDAMLCFSAGAAAGGMCDNNGATAGEECWGDGTSAGTACTDGIGIS